METSDVKEKLNRLFDEMKRAAVEAVEGGLTVPAPVLDDASRSIDCLTRSFLEWLIRNRPYELSFSAEVEPTDLPLIDGDVDPYVPEGWTLERHIKGGKIRWNKEKQKYRMYLSESQKQGRNIAGTDLLNELVSQPILNSVVLYFLIQNPESIPKEWGERDSKGAIRYIYFWGTIYRAADKRLYVRGLYLGRNNRWAWHYVWLGERFGSNSLAAIHAIDMPPQNANVLSEEHLRD